MSNYTIYKDLTNTQAVVVGAVAPRKVKTLIAAGATVKFVTKAVVLNLKIDF